MIQEMSRQELIDHYRFFAIIKALSSQIDNKENASGLQDIFNEYLDIFDTKNKVRKANFIEKGKKVLADLDNIMDNFKSRIKGIAK